MANPSKLGWHSLGTSFQCSCGETHSIPIRKCYVGTDAAQKLAAFARAEYGPRAFVVSDENTRHAAGETLYAALSKAGKTVAEKVYGPSPVDASKDLGDEVATLGRDAGFFVAVGAGTLSDLAKYAGHVNNRPVVLYPTAASMNGYTSAIVALKVRGLKRTLPCPPADAVFADPAVVATAPQRMVAAGVGDFLSKCSSASDWRAAHLLRGGYYCERPREFFEGIQDDVLRYAKSAGAGEETGTLKVLNALLLSGLSMVLAGSSAPASGGEHLISHYLDMKHALYGTSSDLHGTQVGVATVYTLGLWQKILDLEPTGVEIERLLTLRPDDAEVERQIRDDWGAEVSQEVLAQWNEKNLTKDQLRAELLRIAERLPAIKRDIPKDWLPAQVVADAVSAAGGPTTPEGLTAPLEEYKNAQQRARYLRNRFTVLDLAAELALDNQS